MAYKTVVILDGKLFDEVMEEKQILGRYDQTLNEIQFLHKDRLKQAYESGEFLTAPLAFLLFDHLSQEEFIAAESFAKACKKKYDISNCLMMFPAEDSEYYCDPIPQIDSGARIYEWITKIQVIRPSYRVRNEFILTMLSLVLAFVQSCPDEENIAFSQDYVTATVELNYTNYAATILLAYAEIYDRVTEINGKIGDLKTCIDEYRNRPMKKYECHFLPAHIENDRGPAKKIPSKREQMLEFCIGESEAMRRDEEQFLTQGRRDVTTVQSALSRTWPAIRRTGKVDPGAFDEKEFAPEENAPNSGMLLSHVCKKTGSQTETNLLKHLIPFYRVVKNNPDAGVGDILKTAAATIGIVFFGALLALLIRIVHGYQTAGDVRGFYIAGAVFLGTAILALLVGLIYKLVKNKKLKHLLEKAAALRYAFRRRLLDHVKAIRNYINLYSTVTINSFLKTRKITQLEEKIAELQKKKEEYRRISNALKQREERIESLCESAFREENFGLQLDDPEMTNQVKKYIRSHSSATSRNSVAAPCISETPWIKFIAFEIVISR